MNISKFFLCLLLGTPFFYVGAMQEQVQSKEPLTKPAAADASSAELTANAVAKKMYDKKADLFALLRTRYKDLPDERKADIIAAYCTMAGLPLFDAFAPWKQARSTVEPLTKLAAASVAESIYKDKNDLLVLLSTKYKNLPNECKADIISAYSKLIPAEQLLSLILHVVQMSDLAMLDVQAKMLLSKVGVLEKKPGVSDEMVNDEMVNSLKALFLTRSELLKESAALPQARQLLDKLSSTLNRFLPSLDEAERVQALPLDVWELYLRGEYTGRIDRRVYCILETLPSCPFACVALEMVQRLAVHESFEDRAKEQPLTLVCLMEKKISLVAGKLPQNQRMAVYKKKQLSVELIKEALVVLLSGNDWLHAVRQLMLKDEQLALNLLRECLHMRGCSGYMWPDRVSPQCLVEIYFWACVFDMQNIKKFIEEKSPYDSRLPKIKKLYGDSPIILERNDSYYEKVAKEGMLPRDLVRAACRGYFVPILNSYKDLKVLKDLKIPFPTEIGCLWHNVLDFFCKMGYTACVDALLAKGFKIGIGDALANVLIHGHKGLVRKIYTARGLGHIPIPYGTVFSQIDKDKLSGKNAIKCGFADALKIFSECTLQAHREQRFVDLEGLETYHDQRIVDFADLFVSAAIHGNKEIFDYLAQVIR